MILTISTDGTVRCLYQEHVDLDSLGPSETVRASNLEPRGGQWYAEIVNGPVLGPFAKRSAALKAEALWIEENVL